MNASTAIKLLFSEEHISYSAVGKYLRCPRSYKYRYVDRAPPETRSSALVFGTAVHHALAHFYTALKDNQPEPPLDELTDVFRDRFQRDLQGDVPVLFSDRESEDSLLETGAAMLAVFLEKAERPFKVIDVESPFSIELIDPESGEVLPRIVGVFDCVVQDEDGTFRILEHKTAAKRWTEDRLTNELQISAYTYAARLMGLGDAQVDVQVLLKTKKPDFVVYKTNRTDADRSDFVETAVGVVRAAQAGAFYPVRDWPCNGCEYASRCVAG